METSTEAAFEEQHSLQRSTMLRVYNYYRILISFLFMFLFIDKNFGEFVGAVNPDAFSANHCYIPDREHHHRFFTTGDI